jgi:glycosyltransferase involved in cell wall biosynthesis
LHDFEFVIAHRFKPIYIALLATSLPIVAVHHAFGVYSRQSRRWFINRFRRRLLLLGVSNAVRDEIRHCLPGWPAKRVQTLYNRIDAEQVRQEQLPASAAREALTLPSDAWIVGNVGRLHPDKDQATLIRGFAQAIPELPESSLLVIMGSGRLESSLKALVSDLGCEGKVRFLGQVPQGRRYFRAFDVFALTSDHEPFGMVLLEAMAADVPLICADCGGGAEVVQGVGQVFAFGDPKDLSRCLVDQANGVLAPPSFDEALQRFGDSAAKRAFKRILQEAWGG